MRFFTRGLWGLFLFALTAALISYAGYHLATAIRASLETMPSQRQARERVLSVNVVSVTSETITPVLTSYGEVRATRKLELRAPAGGQIISLHPDFAEGGMVSRGAPLIQLDRSDYETTRDKAKAALQDAETDLAEATANLALAREEKTAAEKQAALRGQALLRQRDLLQRGVGTEAAVETAALAEVSAQQSLLSNKRAVAQAEIQIQRAQSTLAKAQIDLAKAERDLNDLTLTAEFDGVLSGVTAVTGGFVTSNEILGELIDPTSLEVAFRVSTAQYARLLGPAGRLTPAPVTVSLDVFGLDLEVSAVLAREAAAVAEGQSGRMLYARLDPSSGLRSGDFVTVRLTEPALENVARLPSTALSPDNTVLVVGADNRLEAVEIQLLRRQQDDVIVRAPALDGKRVVAKQTPLLGEGIRISPIDPTARPDSAPAPVEENVKLDDDRRAKLIAFVESNTGMPEAARARLLTSLQKDEVPQSLVTRLEGRMGAGG